MMNRYLTFLLALHLLVIAGVQAQPLIAPLDLAKKIFSQAKFAGIKLYSTGDFGGYYKCHPDGQDISKEATLTFLLLKQTEEKAVVAMTISDKTGNGVDTYLHFKKEKIWKLSAFRTLSMTEAIYGAIDELENLSEKGIDSLIAGSQKDTTVNTRFKNRNDFDFELGNMKLTVATDDKIIDHFNKNRIAFDRLKDIATDSMKKDSTANNQDFNIGKEFEKEYHKLFIHSIRVDDTELSNGLNFVIGGILDNTVGYLYINDKKSIPEMDPDKIILLREIGDGWYIYKTT